MATKKVYVDVIARFTLEGDLHPVCFRWIDGRIYSVDRILDVRRAASLKAGGVGTRYKCLIRGQEKFIYYEGDNKWFVEAKEAMVS